MPWVGRATAIRPDDRYVASGGGKVKGRWYDRLRRQSPHTHAERAASMRGHGARVHSTTNNWPHCALSCCRTKGKCIRLTLEPHYSLHLGIRVSLPDISFDRIRPLGGGRHSGFEELCVQLAALEPSSAGAAFYRKGQGGDAGVECYRRKDEVVALFESIYPSQGSLQKSLLSRLESEGVLALEPVREEDGSMSEMVRFTFERFSDHVNRIGS
jgi:hypothetical protein